MTTATRDEFEELKHWIGRGETLEDALSAHHIAALAATIDCDDRLPCAREPAPAGCHWLIRPPWLPALQLGSDGHPGRGQFMPPVPLPRRMWASSTITFVEPLRIGDTIVRRSEILDVIVKAGRTGPLVFVKVRHHFSGRDGLALTEDQDIVYRDTPSSADAGAMSERAPPDGPWRRHVTPDPVMLFRYSALTFNCHRIHYDRSYAIEVEKYPGLVVHGPLLATLLLDLIRREVGQRSLARFVVRAMAPVFDTSPFTLGGSPSNNGTEASVWVRRSDGVLAMRGEARFA